MASCHKLAPPSGDSEGTGDRQKATSSGCHQVVLKLKAMLRP